MRLRWIGQIVFSIGLLGAIIGAAKAPVEGATWPDTWPLFLGGWLFSCVGVVLWRVSSASQAATYTIDGDALEILQKINQELQHSYEGWRKVTSCAELNQQISAFQEQYVVPFAVNRSQFITRLGMEAGAEIVITCSYGERMLNRVWSATADAHLPEALASLAEAKEAFSLAVQQLQQAENQQE